VSEMTTSLRGHYRRLGVKKIAAISLQAFLNNSQWRRRRDVQRKSVPQSGSGDRKSSIAMIESKMSLQLVNLSYSE